MRSFVVMSLILVASSLFGGGSSGAGHEQSSPTSPRYENVLALFDASDVVNVDVDADGVLETMFLRPRGDSKVAVGTFAVLDDDGAVMLYVSDINGFTLFHGVLGMRTYAEMEARYRDAVIDAIDEVPPACVEEKEKLVSIRDAVVPTDVPPASGLCPLDEFESSLSEYWQMRAKLETLGSWTDADGGNGCMVEGGPNPGAGGAWVFQLYLLNEEEQPATEPITLVYDVPTATFANQWELLEKDQGAGGDEVAEHPPGSTMVRQRGVLVRVTVDAGRPLFPLRRVVEKLGGRVTWNGQQQVASIDLAGSQATLAAGSTAVTVNGRSVSVGSPPKVIGGRMLVPEDILIKLRGVQAAELERAGGKLLPYPVPGVEVMSSAQLRLGYVRLTG